MTLASLACAEVVPDGNGYRYHLSADAKGAELTFLANDSTNVDAYEGDLVVPETLIYKGTWIDVTGITPLACANCSRLTSVTMAEGIRQIGLGAFSDCTSLQSVSLPETLESMHDLVFYRDSALTHVDLPARIERLGAGTFAYCLQIDSVGMKGGLRSIARQAFYYCRSLSSVVIPASVEAIGEYAFAYCAGLQQLVIGGDNPIAVTPDVFEGVDVSTCRLIVPTDAIEAYRMADVWCDFDIEGGAEGLSDVLVDDHSSLYDIKTHGSELWLTVHGDAPALVYDLSGRRIAVAASRSGLNRIALARGRNYIIRCGRESQVITL